MTSDKEEHEIVVNQFKLVYTDVTVSTLYDNKFEYLGLNFEVHDKTLLVGMPGYVNKIRSECEDLKNVETPYMKHLFENRDIKLLNDKDQTKSRSQSAK